MDHSLPLQDQRVPFEATFMLKKTGIDISEEVSVEEVYENHFLYELDTNSFLVFSETFLEFCFPFLFSTILLTL